VLKTAAKLFKNTFAVTRVMPQTTLRKLTVLSQISVVTITFCCNDLWKSRFISLEKSDKFMKFFSNFVTMLHCHLLGMR